MYRYLSSIWLVFVVSFLFLLTNKEERRRRQEVGVWCLGFLRNVPHNSQASPPPSPSRSRPFKSLVPLRADACVHHLLSGLQKKERRKEFRFRGGVGWASARKQASGAVMMLCTIVC